ncbi:hypothetical protein SAMN05192548_101351 [Paraburkholderia terricola]|uniref:Uncharacterized protein n=1 Tax=Paraburkholderia terricola TaxID=169427 RepID=A0A1M6PLW0_9BURK|nr:hypothetical protein SAMN05192547_101723 [Paraburkholderia sediminicola]SHK08966.1 hypothetical protein SAMN05192548_101351 [Paraburkholderia terricola]
MPWEPPIPPCRIHIVLAEMGVPAVTRALLYDLVGKGLRDQPRGQRTRKNCRH